KIAPRKARILIFGVAFKGSPKTSDMRGSPSLQIVDALRKSGVKNISAFDTAVPTEYIKRAGISPARALQSAVRAADVILCMNNNPDFSAINIKKYSRGRKKPLYIFDGWSVWAEKELHILPSVVYRNL
ncbi:MAG: UDP-glucose/GDP-mannose dehydrogenase family protein, partial [bacterium]|nr:UDP-glucose/GDP-mannose dehydrogenase family protein [bacterium]